MSVFVVLTAGVASAARWEVSLPREGQYVFQFDLGPAPGAEQAAERQEVAPWLAWTCEVVEGRARGSLELTAGVTAPDAPTRLRCRVDGRPRTVRLRWIATETCVAAGAPALEIRDLADARYVAWTGRRELGVGALLERIDDASAAELVDLVDLAGLVPAARPEALSAAVAGWVERRPLASEGELLALAARALPRYGDPFSEAGAWCDAFVAGLGREIADGGLARREVGWVEAGAIACGVDAAGWIARLGSVPPSDDPADVVTARLSDGRLDPEDRPAVEAALARVAPSGLLEFAWLQGVEDPEVARWLAEAAGRADPDRASDQWGAAVALRAAGRFEASDAAVARVRALDPANPAACGPLSRARTLAEAVAASPPR